MNRETHSKLSIGGAILLTLPWVFLWWQGAVKSLSTTGVVAVSGAAVLGASFLLAWGAETAEKDVPRAFALAVLALLAVAPEYAVDALYAWQAGMNPGSSEAGSLAIANMTGANRILVGVGWAGIALFAIYRAGSSDDAAVSGSGLRSGAVRLDRSVATEVVFLLAATVYAFFVPFSTGGLGLDWFDAVILVGLYVAYVLLVLRRGHVEETVHVGVPAYLQTFARAVRIPLVLGLFAFSGGLIFTAVEPFAHGLEHLGLAAGIPPFFMIQWVAPLVSESPELVITAYLVNKLRTTASFNALISSKLNQWTLLVGTLVVVYSLALGRYGAMPFGQKQAAEIWLTAAQSFFAIGILINFRITAKEALVLLGLFLAQVGTEFLLLTFVPGSESVRYLLLLGFTAVYLVGGIWLFATRFGEFRRVLRHTRTPDATDAQAGD